MRQTFEVVEHFIQALRTQEAERHGRRNLPIIRAVLCIGGEDKRAQLGELQQRGVHIVVATPGRLNDFLMRKQMNLNLCKYICLDEGDRMLDLGFDEEVQK